MHTRNNYLVHKIKLIRYILHLSEFAQQLSLEEGNPESAVQTKNTCVVPDSGQQGVWIFHDLFNIRTKIYTAIVKMQSIEPYKWYP